MKRKYLNKYFFNFCSRNNVLIFISFFIAFLLQIIPWPIQIYMLRPSWLLLIFIYWLLISPLSINVGFCFTIGIIMDIISGSSCLGIETLAFITIAYLVLLNFHFINNLALWHQSIIIIILSLIMNIIIFFIEFLINNISFSIEMIFRSLIDGIMWPWIFLIMQKINYKQ